MTKHIVILGERGVGKTPMVRELLRYTNRPLAGFWTKSAPAREDGFHEIYIHPANDPRSEREEQNHFADCNGRDRNIYQNVFEDLGVTYLKHQKKDLIVMDELGFMEAQSPAFCKTVLSCFDGDVPVIASMKAGFETIPFLQQICDHPKTTVYELTKTNWNELCESLIEIVTSWNET